MRYEYEAWFEDIRNTRGFEIQRIYIGTPYENPVTLTPQDWRGSRSRFVRRDSFGYWLVDIRTSGVYEITVRFDPTESPCTAYVSLNGVSKSQALIPGSKSVTFRQLNFEKGEYQLDVWLETGGEKIGVKYVDVSKLL